MDPITRARDLLRLAMRGATKGEADAAAAALARHLLQHGESALGVSEEDCKRREKDARTAGYVEGDSEGFVRGHRAGCDAMAAEFRKRAAAQQARPAEPADLADLEELGQVLEREFGPETSQHVAGFYSSAYAPGFGGVGGGRPYRASVETCSNRPWGRGRGRGSDDDGTG